MHNDRFKKVRNISADICFSMAPVNILWNVLIVVRIVFVYLMFSTEYTLYVKRSEEKSLGKRSVNLMPNECKSYGYSEF